MEIIRGLTHVKVGFPVNTNFDNLMSIFFFFFAVTQKLQIARLDRRGVEGC